MYRKPLSLWNSGCASGLAFSALSKVSFPAARKFFFDFFSAESGFARKTCAAERSVSGKGKYHHHPPAKGGEKRETDPRDYGERCRFLFGVFYMLTNALQAMGAAVQALIINLSRQGII